MSSGGIIPRSATARRSMGSELLLADVSPDMHGALLARGFGLRDHGTRGLVLAYSLCYVFEASGKRLFSVKRGS